MFYKKSTWIVFASICILFTFTAYKLFPNAFTILNIDLSMSREDALSKASDLSKKLNIGPDDYYQVTTFGVDSKAQNFIELDQGGATKFNEIAVEKKYYEAYTWKIRHYKPENVNESWIMFTPQGEFYGFSEVLSDDFFIESLSEIEALEFAVNEAEKLYVNFSNYVLVEKSQDKKPSNRIDHTFVYKRNDISLGDEGEYRLKLVVSGSKLTTVQRYIKIPEAFSMRYEEMRSANNTIAAIANYGILLFYIIGGIIIGLFLLNRERWLIWKPSIIWALFISVLMFVSGLNFFPLSWLGYDTAVSLNNFVIQNILFSIINTVVFSAVLILSFLAAESLSRKAFPHHVQFWKLWKDDNPSSFQVIGQTVGGYLMIGIDLIFVITFYTITSNYLGWWTPSGPLFSPDIIATPFPWLSAIGMSLQAGFWEECLFRAVPLAGAAIIGQKYGNKKMWIFCAMILQAFIFAGAHANYPSYPAYSRLIELIVPSIFWGFVYLRFGLLPVIISHFGYDVVWFAMPLFVSSSSDLLFDKLMVIILLMTPLWVVLKSYIKTKQISELTPDAYNNSFTPSEIVINDDKEYKIEKLTIFKKYKVFVCAIMITGVFLIYLTPNKTYSNLTLDISRNEAINLSKSYLVKNNITLDNKWTMLTSLKTGKIDQDDDYIWSNENAAYYNEILGAYIDNNLWIIRYVKFDGDVNDKSEEYNVVINHDGSLNQIRHKYPENAIGKRISEQDAKNIAVKYIENRFLLMSNQIEEISVSPSNLVNRDDWFLVFKDCFNSTEKSELRIKISISGDEIVSVSRFVHVPEEWGRKYKDDKTFLSIVNIVCYFSMMLFIVYAAASSIAKWSRGSFNYKSFKILLIVLLSLGLLDIINKHPDIISDFSTGSPYFNQLITAFGGNIIFVAVGIFFLSSIIGNITNLPSISSHRFTNIEVIFLSVGVIGLMKGASYTAQLSPYWIIDQGYTNTYLPIFSHLNSSIYTFFNNSLLLMFVFSFLNNVTDFGRQKKWLFIMVLFLFSLSMNGMALGNNLGIDSFYQLLSISVSMSIVFIILYKYFIIYDLTVIPLIVSLMLSTKYLLFSTTNAYPTVLLGNVFPAVFVIFLGYYFRQYLISISK